MRKPTRPWVSQRHSIAAHLARKCTIGLGLWFVLAATLLLNTWLQELAWAMEQSGVYA